MAQTLIAWNRERKFAPNGDPALGGGGARQTRLGDIILADDLASCVQCDQAEVLPGILATETGAVSYGPGKTAAICVPSARDLGQHDAGSLARAPGRGIAPCASCVRVRRRISCHLCFLVDIWAFCRMRKFHP